MNEITPASPINILLVEDDPGDVLMTREALAESKLLNDLQVVSDGREAIDHLQATAAGTKPRPDLVLLDLNLPKVDGREVLEFIKGDTQLRRIPVVILTTSSAEEDIVRSYDLHANAYVTKPVDFEQFMNVVKKVDEFFISVVRRPST
jgi:CheY-like chemotaxis protein